MKLRYLLITFVLMLTASCSTISNEQEEALYKEEASTNIQIELSEEEVFLFSLVNEYRKANNLPTLEFNEEVYSYALEHNNYMIVNGKLSHDNFSVRAESISKITKARFISENVAKNYQFVEDALTGWLESTPHKNTIEGDFTHTTVCITTDDQGNPYYTQIFFKK